MIKLKDYKNFASKDETREHLQYMHVIDGRSYITDGHRALSYETSMSEGVYELKEFNKLEREVHKLARHVLPKINNPLEIEINIPLMFGQLKMTGPSKRLTVYLDTDGEFHLAKPLNFLAAFNPIFFRELAGETVKAKLARERSDLNPMILTVDELSIIVMPKRV